MKPFSEVKRPSNRARAAGKKALQQRRVAGILLAGGDGTRLGFSKPKSLFPISRYQRKSLVQILIEKIQAKEAYLKTKLQVAIMCSKENEEVVRAHVSQFTDTATFFTQMNDSLFEKRRAKHTPISFSSPDGNGAVFSCFEPLFPDVDAVTITPIDNPLADPFDEGLIGYHLLNELDASLIAIQEKNAREKLGGLFEEDQKLRVIEYSEMQNFRPMFFNTGLFCFSRSFMKKVSKEDLPYHWARKKYQGKTVYKREKFLFDALVHTNKVGVISYSRKDCYAALKKRRGDGGIRSVEKALIFQHKTLLEKVTKRKQRAIVELSPEFFYPSENLVKEWRGKFIIKGQYIENKG